MLTGVGVICFAASYGIVLALEISRLYFGSSVRNVLMSLFAWAGLVAHSAYIFHQQIAIDNGQLVNNVQGFFFVVAWGLVVVYLYLSYSIPKTPFGLVLLPLALLLIAGGTYLGDTTPFVVENRSFWRRLHGIAFLATTLSVLSGFVFGVIYLLQEHRLKRKTSGRPGRFRWPSLEWLAGAAFQCVGLSIMCIGVGIFSGLVTNQLMDGSVSPLDPMIIGILVMFVFLLLFFGLLVFRPTAGDRRRIALLTLTSFLFLVAILLYGLLFKDSHWHHHAGIGARAGGVSPPRIPLRVEFPDGILGGLTPPALAPPSSLNGGGQ